MARTPYLELTRGESWSLSLEWRATDIFVGVRWQKSRRPTLATVDVWIAPFPTVSFRLCFWREIPPVPMDGPF